MKKPVQRILHSVIVLSAMQALVSCGPPAKNNGREYGYYGDFNRISNALVSIPGVVVTNYWMNRDITLEEFGFDIITGTKKDVHFGIGERDPLRKMSGQQLVESLKREIARQSEASKTN